MKIIKIISTALLFTTLAFSSVIFAGSILEPVTDTVNSGIINTKMVGHDEFSNVNATVENGIAIFTGEVSSKKQAEKLLRIAHSVTGIRAVNISGLKIQK
jgi:osmotically-inducible protein OsmY